MKKIFNFLRKNFFILVLIVVFIAADIMLTNINPIAGSPLFNNNDLELTQRDHPEKIWDKVFFGSSVVVSSFLENESDSGYINLGVSYGTVSDLYNMIKKNCITVGSEIVIGLNDISFMDELTTNETYLWHKKWYQPYLYFQRDRLFPFLTDGLKNTLRGEPFVTETYENQQKLVCYGSITDEELKASEQSMLDRFGRLTMEDCRKNFDALQKLIDYCKDNGIWLRAVWMPWNEKIAIYDAAVNIMAEANNIFEANNIEVLDVLNAVPVNYFYDIGHLDYEYGAPFFTDLIDSWLKSSGTERYTIFED